LPTLNLALPCCASSAPNAAGRAVTGFAPLIHLYGRDGKLLTMREELTHECPHGGDMRDPCGACFPDLMQLA
jgi:hypothetical protein